MRSLSSSYSCKGKKKAYPKKCSELRIGFSQKLREVSHGVVDSLIALKYTTLPRKVNRPTYAKTSLRHRQNAYNTGERVPCRTRHGARYFRLVCYRNTWRVSLRATICATKDKSCSTTSVCKHISACLIISLIFEFTCL